MQYIIGCSGFHYKHWRGGFYPEKMPMTKWFDFYSEHFKSLELNVSFYRFPTISMLGDWYEKSPDDFTFVLKAPRAITQFKKFIGTERMIRDFFNLIEAGLKEKLECVLFQFPPNFAYSELHLGRILKQLDPAFTNVVEFRHQSWWNAAVFSALAEQNITFCGMSHPSFPDQLVANTETMYYRMHGATQLYASGYSDIELDKLYEQISGLSHLKKALIYFNNDIQGYATQNAAYLIQKISGK